MSFSSLSSYLYLQAPDKYGNQQDDYLLRSELAIEESIEIIQADLNEGKEITDIFFIVQKLLATRRYEIAVDHNTNNSKLFGKSRTEETAEFGTMVTSLDHDYKKYNNIYMKQLGQFMRTTNHTLCRDEQQKKRVQEKALGHFNSFAVNIIGEGSVEFKKMLTVPPTEELQTVLNTEKSLEEIFDSYKLMQELKLKNSSLYAKLYMLPFFYEIAADYPSSKTLSNGRKISCPENYKNLYALGTLRLELDRKLYIMSKYLTWLYQDFKTDPIERMVNHSIVYIIHQDPLLIEPTLQAISKIFEKAIQWNPANDNLEELKNRVALLRFAYAHCMPSFRGDGAIGDWLELALYRFHGFKQTKHNSKTLPCFEPLASISLSNYLKRYDKTISIA